MKKILKYLFILTVFFFCRNFVYADIPGFECKLDGKLVYSKESSYVDNCYIINK